MMGQIDKYREWHTGTGKGSPSKVMKALVKEVADAHFPLSTPADKKRSRKAVSPSAMLFLEAAGYAKPLGVKATFFAEVLTKWMDKLRSADRSAEIKTLFTLISRPTNMVIAADGRWKGCVVLEHMSLTQSVRVKLTVSHAEMTIKKCFLQDWDQPMEGCYAEPTDILDRDMELSSTVKALIGFSEWTLKRNLKNAWDCWNQFCSSRAVHEQVNSKAFKSKVPQSCESDENKVPSLKKAWNCLKQFRSSRAVHEQVNSKTFVSEVPQSCESDENKVLYLDKTNICRPAELLEEISDTEVLLRFRCGDKVKLAVHARVSISRTNGRRSSDSCYGSQGSKVRRQTTQSGGSAQRFERCFACSSNARHS